MAISLPIEVEIDYDSFICFRADNAYQFKWLG
jgi:hypothetical protein